MGLAMAIGVFGGRYVDEWLQTKPVFLFVGMALGIGAGVKALWDAARRIKREWEEDDASPDED
jgi:F0F1-type ATP synthase assembly protein I